MQDGSEIKLLQIYIFKKLISIITNNICNKINCIFI